MSITDIKIGIIGLGYVGLPLALEFGRTFNVLGFDKNYERIVELKKGIDKNKEAKKQQFDSSKKVKFTSNFLDLKDANFYIVTVPTPITSSNKPDLSLVKDVCKKISKIIKFRDILVFESTVFPGATEEEFIPLIEKMSGLKGNKDFFYGYSPERINPGDQNRTLTKILKIVSGSNNYSLSIIKKVYGRIIKAGLYIADNIKIAEAAKVIENTQRDLNIALINELAFIFNKLNIDTNKVLDAANTKWNFINFRPGLVGGHCIGVDPYYLTYKAKKAGYNSKLILAGRKINNGVSKYIAKNILKKLDKNLSKKKLIIFGFTFKENCSDFRNTKVIDIIKELKKNKISIDIFDPHVIKKDFSKSYKYNLINDFKKIKKNYYDGIILAVNHDIFKKITLKKILLLCKKNKVIYDVKNIFPNYKSSLKL